MRLAPLVVSRKRRVAYPRRICAWVTVLDRNGQPCGFICLVYDNYFAVVSCADTQQTLDNRILRNARHFNIILKEHKNLSYKDLAREDTSCFFCGIHLRVSVSRSRALSWRHAPDRFEKYIRTFNELLSAPEKKLSTREIARILGRIIWHEHMALRPLLHSRALIDVLRRATKLRLAENANWDDAIFTLTDAEFNAINTYWQSIRNNPYIALQDQGKCRHVFTEC
jgi:hypothetical protein